MKKEILEDERRRCKTCNHKKVDHGIGGCLDNKGFWSWLFHGLEFQECECEKFEP